MQLAPPCASPCDRQPGAPRRRVRLGGSPVEVAIRRRDEGQACPGPQARDRWSATPSWITRPSRSRSRAPRATANTKCLADRDHRAGGHRFRCRDDQARRQGARRRGLLRPADLDRGDGGQLERPVRYRVRLGGDQCHPDGPPVDDPAVLLRPATLPRPKALDREEAVRPRRQEDRHLHRAAPSSPTSRAPSRSPESTSSRRSRTRRLSASRPRAPVSTPSPPARSTPS